MIFGAPFFAASNRYIRWSETMKTPRFPTAKEFSISWPRVLTRIAPVLGLSVPTFPFCFVTNQISPLKSGSADVIRSLDGVDDPGEVVVAGLRQRAPVRRTR